MDLPELMTLDRAGLSQLWLELFGHPPPHKSRGDLVRLVLGWHLQALKFGGLSASDLRRLHGVKSPSLSIGSRLIRVWQGETHQVTVLKDGFLYNGKTWKSLSAIARAITGTAWSGPVFFGLKS
jgi:hypothetical protein